MEELSATAALVHALKSAVGYCNGVYDVLTDASGIQSIEVSTDGGREINIPRIAELVLNYSHDEEHYGNLVTYTRIQSIVPPSMARNMWPR